jgi:hypothetical protein
MSICMPMDSVIKEGHFIAELPCFTIKCKSAPDKYNKGSKNKFINITLYGEYR